MCLAISKEEFDAINDIASKHKSLRLSDGQYLMRPFKDWYDILKEGRRY